MKNKYPKEWNYQVITSPESGGVPTISQEDPEVTEAYDTTVKDMATVIPQGMTFDYADEIINTVSPELAEDYRTLVAQARKNSPMATTVAEILTPDALSLLGASAVTKGSKIANILSKMGKAGTGVKKVVAGEGRLGSIGQDVATSMLQQGGESGEVDPLSTVLSTGASQVLKAVPKAVFGDTNKIRAGYTGVRDSVKDLQPKAKGLETGEDVARNLMDSVEEINFLNGGKHTFNSETLKFEPATKLARMKGKITPAKTTELIARADDSKKKIFSEMEKMVDEWDVGESFDFVDPELSVASGRFGAVTREEFEEDIANEIIDSLPTMSSAEEKRIIKEIKFHGDKIFKGGSQEAGLKDLLKAKRDLYSRTDYTKESDALGINLRKAIAGKLNKKINDLVPDERFRKLNKLYGDMSQLDDSLRMHKDKKFMTKDEFRAQYGAVSPVYGAASYIQDKLEPISRPISQMAGTVQKTPLGEQMLGQPVRKGAADLFSTPNAMTEEDLMTDEEKQQAVPYRPQTSIIPARERMEMNIPKQIIKAKMPRTSQGLIENGQVFKLKVAQEAKNIVLERMTKAGVDPNDVDPEEIDVAAKDLYENVKMVLDEDPDQVAKILPVWIQQMPQMFENDRYGRIEGVVPQVLRMDVSEEIRKNKQISNVERISQLGKLNSSGEYSWDLDSKENV